MKRSPEQIAREGTISDTSHRQYLATLLKFWTCCGEAQCRRARSCKGDYDECFIRLWRHVPEDTKIRVRSISHALARGKSPQEALRFADDEVERIRDLDRREAEREDALRFPREVAPVAQAVAIAPVPDAARVGPRIRSL